MTTTTTDSAPGSAQAAPIRPRGAARRAANDAAARSVRVGRQTAEAAVPPAAASVSTTTTTIDGARSGAALPSRRDLRTPRRSADRPGRLGKHNKHGLRVPDLRVPDPRVSGRPGRDRHVPELRRGVAVGRPQRPAALPAARSGSSSRLLPVTASALAACLVVSVSTPAAALDDPTGFGLGAAPASAPAHQVAPAPEQHYRVASGVTVTVVRDGFDVQATRAGGDRHGRVQITTGSDVVRPVAGTIPTAGGFGGRQVAGCGACSTNHHGLDFAAASGTPVVAAMPGRVVSAGPLGGYGNQVLLAHPDGTQTRYGHLSRIDVLPGQTLSAGEQLGAVGSTGVSTGPHLHFEVIVGGTPIDPAPWLAARGLL
ncbi:M23 family metallopeptidase [Curtobacterium sp. MR_MD2014]|uniref:M23 family metallopeptidase n=1 Tax=Curtobacterium sp. MR_MD2014 TaxID=1561023 RepID=UPI000A4363B6|nr:M23 family metallopeptidase [Curtobacterium sp. MR_MD2014]